MTVAGQYDDEMSGEWGVNRAERPLSDLEVAGVVSVTRQVTEHLCPVSTDTLGECSYGSLIIKRIGINNE